MVGFSYASLVVVLVYSLLLIIYVYTLFLGALKIETFLAPVQVYPKCATLLIIGMPIFGVSLPKCLNLLQIYYANHPPNNRQTYLMINEQFASATTSR